MLQKNIFDIFNINLGSRSVCLQEDYQSLEAFYRIFYAPKEVDKKTDDNIEINTEMSKENELIHKFKLDEAIEISFKNNGEARRLVVNFDFIINLPNLVEVKQKVNQHEYTVKVFDELLTRFEKKTNLFKLDNIQTYTKVLFNFVNSKLNPSKYILNDHDELTLQEIANSLDLK